MKQDMTQTRLAGMTIDEIEQEAVSFLQDSLPQYPKR